MTDFAGDTSFFLPYCVTIFNNLVKIQGTVIRVFSVPDGVKQFEFRRGMRR